MGTDVENIIKEIEIPSQAELDRTQIKSIRSLNLIAFVDAQVAKATAENKLKSVVTAKILTKLTDPNEDIDLVSLTHLLGVLSKSDNEFILGLITSIKDFYQIEKEADAGRLGNVGDNLNVEDIKIARRVAKLLEKFSDAELSDSEQ
jgi:hypothetical protein